MMISRLKNQDWLKKLFRIRLPYCRVYADLLLSVRSALKFFFIWLKNVFLFDQMIHYQCSKVGKNVIFWGTYPLIANNGAIELGDDVCFVGQNNLLVGFNVPGVELPSLVIGDNVTIGYRCEINCAASIRIGSNVRIATGVKIFDNNSHPLAAGPRRLRQPMTMDDVRPVAIEDDVWIGMEAFILKGVVIGKGSVVAAGAVVTKSVPSGVVVAGNPARIVKALL